MLPSPNWRGAIAMRQPTNLTKAATSRKRSRSPNWAMAAPRLREKPPGDGLRNRFLGRPAAKPFIAGRLGTSFVALSNHLPKLTYRSEEHTSELQSLRHLVCRLLLEKK